MPQNRRKGYAITWRAERKENFLWKFLAKSQPVGLVGIDSVFYEPRSQQKSWATSRKHYGGLIRQLKIRLGGFASPILN